MRVQGFLQKREKIMAIIKCKCTNEYQDKRYGIGMRVANRRFGKGKETFFRCTVCEAEYDIPVMRASKDDTGKGTK